jgi:hypothetical protein
MWVQLLLTLVVLSLIALVSLVFYYYMVAGISHVQVSPGDVFVHNSVLYITWQGISKVQFQLDHGAGYEPVVMLGEGHRRHMTVPTILSDKCRIRVSDPHRGDRRFAESPPFRIVPTFILSHTRQYIGFEVSKEIFWPYKCSVNLEPLILEYKKDGWHEFPTYSIDYDRQYVCLEVDTTFKGLQLSIRLRTLDEHYETITPFPVTFTETVGGTVQGEGPLTAMRVFADQEGTMSSSVPYMKPFYVLHNDGWQVADTTLSYWNAEWLDVAAQDVDNQTFTVSLDYAGKTKLRVLSGSQTLVSQEFFVEPTISVSLHVEEHMIISLTTDLKWEHVKDIVDNKRCSLSVDNQALDIQGLRQMTHGFDILFQKSTDSTFTFALKFEGFTYSLQVSS